MTSTPPRPFFDSISFDPGGRLSSREGRRVLARTVPYFSGEFLSVGTSELAGESFGGSVSKPRPDLCIRIIPIAAIRSRIAVAGSNFFI
jgi:hypothetical protein